MLKRLFFLFIFISLLFVLHAESKQDFEYKIGPEDVIKIMVDRHPELNITMPVGPDGYISYPLIGNIKASNLTRKELKDVITKKLSKFFKNPLVSVVILEYNSYKVGVLGEVEEPGLYVLKSDPTLLHALSMAGGPSDAASLDEAYLKRANRDDLIKLDLYALLVQGDLSKNVVLYPGDIVFIPKGTKNQIYIMGEVKKPGIYTMKEGLSLLEAIGMAGSETDKAILKKTMVIRGRGLGKDPDIYIVNVDQILKKGNMKYNLKLQAGDIVYVPKSAKPEWGRILPMLQTIDITHNLIKGW